MSCTEVGKFTKVHYRWCKTVATQSKHVKLITSFASKKTPVSLFWDNKKLLYISDLITTPCGRHSGYLLIDGNVYPCEEFVISFHMFEVNIFTKDSSSDENGQFFPSHFVKKRTMKPIRTSSESDVRISDFSLDKKSKSVHFTKHLSKSLHDIPENSDFSSEKMLSSRGSSSIEQSRSSEDLVGRKTWQKQEKFHSCSSLSTLPCFGETENKDRKDFTSFWNSAEDKKMANVSTIGSVFDAEKQLSVEPHFPFERSLQSSVEMTSEEVDRNIDVIEVAASVFPRQYIKKSVEVEKSADQVIRSVEKSVALIDNFIPICTGNERFIEIGIKGSLNTTNSMKVELIDNASQTVDVNIPHEETDRKVAVSIECKDDAVQATEFWDQFREEHENKLKLTQVDSAVQTVTEELDEKYLVRTKEIGSSQLQEVVEEECKQKFVFHVGNGEAETFLSDEDSRSPSVSQLNEDVTDDEKKLEKLIVEDKYNVQNGEMSSTDLEAKEDLDINISETEEEKDEVLLQLEEQITPKEMIEHPIMETVLEEQNGDEDSLEAMKNRVCDREQQVQHLQKEIMKLDDSNLHLQQEQMELFRFSSTQSLGSEDDSQFLESQKDPVSLAREIDALRIQVGDQERARSSLEWEVQALRERLDNNDPAEVAQLIEEMRSLREELSSLTTKNKDLYDEIVKLREENTVLKRERCRNGSHLNQKKTVLQEDIHSKLKGRRYQEPSYFSSVQDRFHTDSGSSTDSLLDEADELVRMSMEKIIDGIYDKQPTTSRRENSRKKLSFVHGSHSRPRTSTPRREEYSYIPTHPDSPSLSSPASFPFIPKSSTDLTEGYRVRFMHPKGGMEEGVVRYVSSFPSKQDTLIGVELAQTTGDSNGIYNGTKYFTCEMNKGIFISLRKVVLVWPQDQ